MSDDPTARVLRRLRELHEASVNAARQYDEWAHVPITQKSYASCRRAALHTARERDRQLLAALSDALPLLLAVAEAARRLPRPHPRVVRSGCPCEACCLERALGTLGSSDSPDRAAALDREEAP